MALTSLPARPAVPCSCSRYIPARNSLRSGVAGVLLMEIALALFLLTLAAAASWPRAARQLQRLQQADMETTVRALLWSRRSAISSGNCKQLCLANGPYPSNEADCLGPGATLYLRDCGSGRLLLTVQLRQSLARWKGLRSNIPAGFDAQGRPLAVSGSLYLCTPDTEKALIARYIVNRSGRIRTAAAGESSACPGA